MIFILYYSIHLKAVNKSSEVNSERIRIRFNFGFICHNIRYLRGKIPDDPLYARGTSPGRPGVGRRLQPPEPAGKEVLRSLQ